MKYNRCPHCAYPLYFHAVTVTQGLWRKWLYCEHCTQFTHVNQYGENPMMSKTPPAKYALAKDEQYGDDGNSAFRLGQDDIFSLPGMQQDWIGT